MSGTSGLLRRIATVGPVGFLPHAAGTYASLLTLPLIWALHRVGMFWAVGPATIAIIVLGQYATRAYLDALGEPDADPSEVVIDEVAGMMIALWPLSLGLTLAGADPTVFPWPGVVFGFLCFRALDILKPPPISWAEAAPGATGVMLDDIVAGAITALLATVAAGIAHGWL